MKKSVTITTSIGLALMLICGAVFCTLPLMTPQAAFYGVESFKWATIVETFQGLFSFTNIGLPQILIFVFGGLGALIFLASIVVMFVKRRPAGLFASIFLLIELGLALVGFTLLLHPNVETVFVDPNGTLLDGQPWGWFQMATSLYQKEAGMRGYAAIICYVLVGLFGLGFILGLFSTFGDMIAGEAKEKKAKAPKEKKAKAQEQTLGELPLPSHGDDVIVVHDDEIIPPASEEDIAAALGVNVAPSAPNPSSSPAKEGPAAPSPAPAPAAPLYSPAQGIQGPLLVQYINTYSPAQNETSMGAKAKNGQVPLSEIQGAITGEKPLTAEDIRKIVREEMAPKEEEKQPVIISVPSPAKAERASLSAEDVRRIFSEELTKTLGQEEGDVLIEEAPSPALTAEEIRSIIASEIASSKKQEAPIPEPAPAAPQAMNEEHIRSAIAQEIRSFYAEKELEKKEEEKPLSPSPAPAPSLSATEIRQIINEELSRREVVEEKPTLTPEVIRDIIRQEMVSVAPLQEEPVKPVTVVLKAPEEEKAAPAPVVEPVVKQAEPSPAPAPTPAPVKEEAKVEEVKPAPVSNPTVTVVVQTLPAQEQVKIIEPAPKEEPKPVEAPKPRVVGAINPNLPPHDKIIRIPFQTRMKEADKEMRDNYNELKSEIMSYGVKSRISNKGDTFRLHKVTFVKISIAGKSLKLYFALDPKDYENSPIPVQDAGHKGVYKDIPLVFKVKSELSMRRAKELIANVMEKNGLEQGKIVPRDWASEIPDAKEADSSEE